MDKKLSIRIRKNRFDFHKSNGKNYKSVKQQIEHDRRIEKMDKGYLKNNNKNFFQSADFMRNEKNQFDKNDIDKNLLNEFEKIKADYKEKNGKKWQEKTIPAITGVLSFSSGFMLDENKSIDLLKTLGNFVKQEFSQYIDISVHRDESSLHCHFTIFNYNYNTGKTIARNIDTSKLQDKIADFLKEKGQDYGHVRGVNKIISKNQHLEILDSKRLENGKLTKKNQELEENKIAILKSRNAIMEELKIIINDIIAMGELDKGLNMLRTAKRYLDKDQMEKFDNLQNKAKRTLNAIIKANNQNNKKTTKKTTKKAK